MINQVLRNGCPENNSTVFSRQPLFYLPDIIKAVDFPHLNEPNLLLEAHKLQQVLGLLDA